VTADTHHRCALSLTMPKYICAGLDRYATKHNCEAEQAIVMILDSYVGGHPNYAEIGALLATKRTAETDRRDANFAKACSPRLELKDIKCTCGSVTDKHKHFCRIYQTLKKRESRERRKAVLGVQ